MKTKQELDKATEDFFKMHWNSDVIKLNKTWNWEWVEYDLIGTMCNHDKQGCYAFLKDQKIVYVGLGAG